MSGKCKWRYADDVFGLPVEQVFYYHELTPEQKERCHYLFGKSDANRFVYALKKSGDFVPNRARLRPEWGD